MKLLVPLILLFHSIVLAQYSGKVVGIKDGDTIVVLLDGNVQKTLRLAEVDCPESGQPFGKNAKQFASDQVFGKVVDYWETDTDQWGRSIAKVFYDGKYLSAELIKAGYGWWYYRYSSDKRLQELERSAKEKRIGLWVDTNPIAPWEYRRLKR